MRKRVLFLLLLVVALGARPASADEVKITSGAFLVDIEGDMFTFNGAGFILTTTGIGHYMTKLFPARCSQTSWPFQSCPQAEGTLADWSFRTTGEQLLGTGDVMLDGVNATNVDFIGSMRFDVVPTPVSSGGKLEFGWSAPFSFNGMIRGMEGEEELFARQFIGSGLVKLGYEVVRPGFLGLNADTDTIRYEFAAADPVPEPGTLLLLGSGLAAAAVQRRRRQT